MIPTRSECLVFWDRYQMLPQIRDHSLLVAAVALQIADLARAKGLPVNQGLLEAAALLHDLAKTYTIRHGGNHSQLGAAWVVHLTGNLAMAQAIIHHFHWPGEILVQNHLLPLIILYADKRVKHDEIVSVEDRFQDLFLRYGRNDQLIVLMQRSLKQTQAIENSLSHKLEVDLDAHPFDRGWMVQ